jgi:hypothetical protein
MCAWTLIYSAFEEARGSTNSRKSLASVFLFFKYKCFFYSFHFQIYYR